MVKTTPGEEGTWFADAKEVVLYDEAPALASRTLCDPKTLIRAVRDFSDRQPSFAVGAELLAIHWLVQGYGYEITGADVWAAYSSTMTAAEKNGNASEVRECVKKLIANEPPGGFVARIPRQGVGTVMSRKRPEIRIAIDGKYLDEVQIRQAEPYAPHAVCYLSFPAHRHWAQLKGDRVTVSAQAPTVVALFADGVLPAVGGRTVVVEVGGEKIGPCLLEAVESGERNGVDDVIVLRFRRSSRTAS
jgi:hypothetical protein